MNFVFSMVFFAVWPGGRRCAKWRDAHFFERYCDESIFTWKTCKTTMEKKQKKTKKTKSSDPWARSGERPGRGHGSELFVFFFFSMVFCSLAKTLRKPKKTKNKKVQTHGQGLGYPHTNQKKKKQKKQETKKPKKQKTKKNKKTRLYTPRGGGQMQSVGSCLFVFFVFWFFGFLVCVWIAIADVPSRDCQALSVVALEARSIHYSTAMFAMT